MNLYMNGGENMMDSSLEAMVDIIQGKNVESAREVLFQNVTEPEVPEPVYTDGYRENYLGGYVPAIRVYEGMGSDEPDDEEETGEHFDNSSFDMDAGLEALVDAQMKKRAAEEESIAQRQRDLDEANATAMNAYLDQKEEEGHAGTDHVPEVTVAEQPDEPKVESDLGITTEDNVTPEEPESFDYTEQEGRFILVPTPDEFPEGQNIAIMDRHTDSLYEVDGEIVAFETPEDASQYLDELYRSLPVDGVEEIVQEEESKPSDEPVAEGDISESESESEEKELADEGTMTKTEEASILVDGKPIQIGQEVKVDV